MFFSTLRSSSRRSPRHTLRADCQVVRERDFCLIADRVMDLSDTGILVGPADPVLTGERLIVSFQVPRSRLWVDAEATVARVVHGRRNGEYRRLLALEFEEFAGLSRLMLRYAIDGLPPAPPSASRIRRFDFELTRALVQ